MPYTFWERRFHLFLCRLGWHSKPIPGYEGMTLLGYHCAHCRKEL